MPDAGISINGQVVAIIESKIGDYAPTEVQLKGHFATCPTTRLLLLITSKSSHKKLEDVDDRIAHITWSHAKAWAKQYAGRNHAERKLIKDLLFYWEKMNAEYRQKVFKK